MPPTTFSTIYNGLTTFSTITINPTPFPSPPISGLTFWSSTVVLPGLRLRFRFFPNPYEMASISSSPRTVEEIFKYYSRRHGMEGKTMRDMKSEDMIMQNRRSRTKGGNCNSSQRKSSSRELKRVKEDLDSAKKKCCELEEENKIPREVNEMEKGDHPAHDDDDMIQIWLEMLLEEKGRLAHENSVYAHENMHLRELIEYHQLIITDVEAMKSYIYDVDPSLASCGIAIAKQLAQVDCHVLEAPKVSQMSAIREELRDNDEVAAFERKMQDAGMPQNIWKHAHKELRKVKNMQAHGIVAHVFTLSFLLICHGRQEETTIEEVELNL
ncbi:unnamed protein product [Lactuca virosa]|uniref:Uncharacterized protein n=1 Tax=Lactuca virosa TaxID=75947 RepID=A0AAU9MUQ6_9ASTR|nr:unnamed protein product [Lactuca virosa]CAH1429809.1 unnamed protein product [Lactuca virosa]